MLGEEVFISVDFHLPDQGKIVEVNGRVHYEPLFGHPRHLESRQDKERERLRRLRKAGFEMLVIDHRDLEADEAAIRRQIIEFVEDRSTGDPVWRNARSASEKR